MMIFYVMDIWKQTELIFEDFLHLEERESPYLPIYRMVKITYAAHQSEKQMKGLWGLRGNQHSQCLEAADSVASHTGHKWFQPTTHQRARPGRSLLS